MEFNPQLIAKQILAQISLENILSVNSCMTRLRITLKNKSLVEVNKLRLIEDVIGVVDTANQLQVIIGAGKVYKVHQQMMLLINASTSEKLAVTPGLNPSIKETSSNTKQAFNPQLIAEQIFAELTNTGIVGVDKCMTRLRVTLNNKQKIQLNAIKSIDGVLGVVDTPDQLQIIIGPGKVNQVYDQFMNLFNTSSFVTSSAPDAQTIKEQLKQKNSTEFKLFLKKIANIFIPMIPAFIGCGLVLGFVSILSKSLSPEMLGGVPFDKTTIGAILKLIGLGITFGLAIFTGLNASKEFGGSPIYGGVLACVLTMPGLADIVIFGEHAVPGRGGVIAVLFVAIFAAYLERKIRKIIPSSLDLFLTPFFVLLISGILAVYVLQPIGGYISDNISNAVKLAITHGGALTGFILGATFLPLVMTGLHQGLIPIHAELISTTGSTVLLPMLAMAGGGQVGSTLAVWAKTKNKKLSHIIKSGILVGFMGVGEPLIYGVTLPLFRPFIGACIGGGLGGAVVGYLHLGANGIGISGIPLALIIVNGPLLYLLGLLVSYIGGFIATWLIGFDDSIFD